MPTHTFISYSTADAADFAMRLADALTAGPPSFAAWRCSPPARRTPVLH